MAPITTLVSPSSPTSHVTDRSTSTAPTGHAGTTRPAGATPTTRPAAAAQQRTTTAVVPELGINTARPIAGVLLNVQATGSLVTQPFRAPATWRIVYQADCSNLPAAGAFQVALVGASRKEVVNIGTEAQTAVVPEQGAGTYHLVITTPCDYLLQALPGTGT